MLVQKIACFVFFRRTWRKLISKLGKSSIYINFLKFLKKFLNRYYTGFLIKEFLVTQLFSISPRIIIQLIKYIYIYVHLVFQRKK